MNNKSLEECLLGTFGKTVDDCMGCFKLKERPQWLLSIHAAIIGLVIVVTLIGNFLFVALVLKYKKFQHSTTMITLSIIIANTILLFNFHIPAFVSTVSAEWLFHFPGCQTFGFFSSDAIIVRFLTMGLLSFDRFSVVRFPFSYPKYKKRLVITLLSACWILPIISSLATVGYASVTFRQDLPTCLFYTPGVGRGLVFFSIVTSAAFLIGGFIPMGLYIWLFKRARKLRHSTGNLGSVTHSKDNVINVRGMHSGGSSELRPMVTFVLIFIAFILTGLPTYCLQLLRTFNIDAWCSIDPIIHFIAIECFISSTALDPYIILRNREFKKRLRHLICCHNNCGRYYNDRSAMYPEIPPERDLDAMRSIASKTFNMMVPQSLLGSTTSLSSSTESMARSSQPRSNGLPLTFYPGRRPSTVAIIPDTIREVETETETSRSRLLERSENAKDVKVDVHCEFAHMLPANESIEISITFHE